MGFFIQITQRHILAVSGPSFDPNFLVRLLLIGRNGSCSIIAAVVAHTQELLQARRVLLACKVEQQLLSLFDPSQRLHKSPHLVALSYFAENGDGAVEIEGVCF